MLNIIFSLSFIEGCVVMMRLSFFVSYTVLWLLSGKWLAICDDDKEEQEEFPQYGNRFFENVS